MTLGLLRRLLRAVRYRRRWKAIADAAQKEAEGAIARHDRRRHAGRPAARGDRHAVVRPRPS
jgi:hypothetical protein